MIGRYRDYLPAIGLGITQILGYGTLMYAYAVLLPHMAQDLGIELSTAFGLLSLGLFFGGAAAPIAGRLVDRFGGRWVMIAGSVVAGLAVMNLGGVDSQWALFASVLLAEAAGMFVLYDVAFASVARLGLSLPSQRSISIITLFGGVASTIYWPLTLALFNAYGWEMAWRVLGVSYLALSLPIHAFVLRSRRGPVDEITPPQSSHWPELTGAARARSMVWMIVSFALAGYVMSGVMALWVTNAQDIGHSAAMAALAGAVIGPFKTIGRLSEMLVGRALHPLVTYGGSLVLMMLSFVVLLTIGFTAPGIIVAAALYGMGDGIKTIARGTLPLALFGARGYGARLGWISFVQMGAVASAPFVFAWLTQSYGGWWSFAAMAVCLVAALSARAFIHGPKVRSELPRR